MQEIKIPETELKNRHEIYSAIDQYHRFTVGDIIDIINYHPMMHFGSKNISSELCSIIIYAYSKHSVLGAYLVKEYHEEIDISQLIYFGLKFELEPEYFLDFTDFYDGKGNFKVEIIKIIMRNYSDDDYLDMLLGLDKLICSISEKDIIKHFNRFNRKFIIAPNSKKVIIAISNKYECFSNRFLKVFKDQPELLAAIYPDLNIFIF